MRKIKHKSRKNKKRRGNPISRGLAKVTDSLYSVASSSATGRALNEYDGGERAFGKSFLLGKIKTFFKNIDTKKLKYAFGKSVEQSKIVHVYSRIIDVLLTSLVRQYGVCVFSLGLYTLLIYFFGSYAVDIFDVSLLHFGVGAAEVICSIPMLASRKTLAAALKESRAADLILFNILGISSESLERERGVSSPMGVIPIILGLVAGLATTFISPVTILLSVLTVICLCIGLCAPESALVLVIALSPFMSEGVLQAAVFYLLISYILKVLRGKRVFRFEFTDCAVLAFAVILLISSIYSVSPIISRSYAPVIATYICIYFIIVNTIKTKPWIGRIIFSIVFSLCASVLYGIGQYFISKADFILTEDMIRGEALRATFVSPAVMAQFIILFGSYLIAFYLTHKTSFVRSGFVFMLIAVMTVCLYLTMTPLAMLCFLISLVIFFMLYSRRTIIFVVLLGIAIPFTKFIIPHWLGAKITDYVNLAKEQVIERANGLKTSLALAGDYLWGGSGTGTFSYLYTNQVSGTADSAAYSYNTYVETLTELGIIGLVVFLCVVFLFFKSNFSLFAKIGTGKQTVYSAAGISGLIGVLLLGFTESLWTDTHFVLAFWVAMGLCVAMKRLAIFEQKGYEEYLLGNK